MAARCDQLPCCKDVSYKKCVDIRCGDGEDSQQCRIPNPIKSVDCFCAVLAHSCLNEGHSHGIETDEGENNIWVDNGCHESQCQHGETKATSVGTGKNVTNTKKAFRTTTALPPSNSLYTTQSNISGEQESSNTGLLLGLPLALVIGVMVVIIVLYFKFSRRKSEKKKRNAKSPSKKVTTYMQNIEIDNEVVYDVITANHTNRNNSSKSEDHAPFYRPNIRNVDQSKEVLERGNGNYRTSEMEDNDINSHMAAENYYVTPSEVAAGYVVPWNTKKKDGSQNPKQNDEKDHLSGHLDLGVNYFVLEKDTRDTGHRNTQLIKDENDQKDKYDPTVNYFVLEKDGNDQCSTKALRREEQNDPKRLPPPSINDYFVLEKN